MAVHKEYQHGNGIIVKAPYYDIACKYCGSKNIIKWGTFRGIQRFWCKDCHHKFADNNALPNMQTPIEQIGSAVGMYYEGQSLNSVRRLIAQIYSSYPSDSSVYRWVTRFTEQAIVETQSYKPNVGDTWVADETVLDIDGKNVWFWDIIDSRTRFLLASHISRARTTKDAQKLMELAVQRAGKKPKVVLTDKLAAYVDGIELAFGADSKHIRSKPFSEENSTNLIERFHGTLKARTKVMRGLKDIETARLITEGWLVHYNYIRPHEALGDKTPAEVASIKFPYRNWQDIVAKKQPVTPRQVSATSSIRIPDVSDLPRYTESGFKVAHRKPKRIRKQQSQRSMASLSIIR